MAFLGLQVTSFVVFQIPDPTAVKPDDWDVPPQIQDPSAIKPENWIDDEEEMIPGRRYKISEKT